MNGRRYVATIVIIISVVFLFAEGCVAAGTQGEDTDVYKKTLQLYQFFALSGENFLSLPEQEQIIYVAGVIGGYGLAPVFGASDTSPTLQWLSSCVHDKSSRQITAIFRKYLTDHPEKWNQFCAPLMISCLIESCRDIPPHR